MRLSRFFLAAGALLAAIPAVAGGTDGVRFAPPMRIKAGSAFVGEGRLYPSPAIHDADGDGRPDLLIADLAGRVSFAARSDGEGPVSFAAEKTLTGADGQPLDFSNW